MHSRTAYKDIAMTEKDNLMTMKGTKTYKKGTQTTIHQLLCFNHPTASGGLVFRTPGSHRSCLHDRLFRKRNEKKNEERIKND